MLYIGSATWRSDGFLHQPLFIYSFIFLFLRFFIVRYPTTTHNRAPASRFLVQSVKRSSVTSTYQRSCLLMEVLQVCLNISQQNKRINVVCLQTFNLLLSVIFPVHPSQTSYPFCCSVLFCKSVRVCASLCEFVWDCVSLCEIVRVCVRLYEFVWVCVRMCESVWDWASLCEFVRVYISSVLVYLL